MIILKTSLSYDEYKINLYITQSDIQNIRNN